MDVLIVCPSFIDTGIDRAALGADGQPAAQARKTTGDTTSPARVAAAILQAAQQRRQLLLFSFTAKAWWLSRLSPTRYAAVMKKRLQSEIFPHPPTDPHTPMMMKNKPSHWAPCFWHWHGRRCCCCRLHRHRARRQAAALW